MSVLYIAIPLALIIAFIAIVAFVVQVRTGQYDDLETPAQRMLFDDAEATGTPTPRKDHQVQ
jgi:cbb3-type cytochrome oxidase maturation protein